MIRTGGVFCGVGSDTAAAFGSAENDCDFTVSVCTLIGKFAWFAGRVVDLFETAILKVS